ncbi:uncharacterized protein [Periplaneta americana]|uniref:uncharacterized protein isoform X3 n=1 Tax=Periplaneta americana TaxID=6978 RepID=UPI0037E8C3CA
MTFQTWIFNVSFILSVFTILDTPNLVYGAGCTITEDGIPYDLSSGTAVGLKHMTDTDLPGLLYSFPVEGVDKFEPSNEQTLYLDFQYNKPNLDIFLVESYSEFEEHQGTVFDSVSIVLLASCTGSSKTSRLEVRATIDIFTNNYPPKFESDYYEVTVPVPLPAHFTLFGGCDTQIINVMDYDVQYSHYESSLEITDPGNTEEFSIKLSERIEKNWTIDISTSKTLRIEEPLEFTLIATDIDPTGKGTKSLLGEAKIKIIPDIEKSTPASPLFEEAIYTLELRSRELHTIEATLIEGFSGNPTVNLVYKDGADLTPFFDYPITISGSTVTLQQKEEFPDDVLTDNFGVMILEVTQEGAQHVGKTVIFVTLPGNYATTTTSTTITTTECAPCTTEITTECPDITTISTTECPTCEPCPQTTTAETTTAETTTECPTVTCTPCPETTTESSTVSSTPCPECPTVTCTPCPETTTESSTVSSTPCPECPTEPCTPCPETTTECPVTCPSVATCEPCSTDTTGTTVTTECPLTCTPCPTETTTQCPEVNCPSDGTSIGTTYSSTGTTSGTGTTTTGTGTTTTGTGTTTTGTTTTGTGTETTVTTTTESGNTGDTCPPCNCGSSTSTTTTISSGTCDCCSLCSSTDPSDSTCPPCAESTTTCTPCDVTDTPGSTCPSCPENPECPESPTTCKPCDVTVPPGETKSVKFLEPEAIVSIFPIARGPIKVMSASCNYDCVLKYRFENADGDLEKKLEINSSNGTISVKEEIKSSSIFNVIAEDEQDSTLSSKALVFLNLYTMTPCIGEDGSQWSYSFSIKNIKEGMQAQSLEKCNWNETCSCVLNDIEPSAAKDFISVDKEVVIHTPIDRENRNLFPDPTKTDIILYLESKCQSAAPESWNSLSRSGIYDIGNVAYNAAKTVIVIHIEDINDNAPTFDTTSLTVGYPDADIAEYFSSSLLTQVQATDADFGENAVIKYILDGTDEFTIHEDTGMIHPVEGAFKYKDTSFIVHASNLEQVGNVTVNVKILEAKHLLIIKKTASVLDADNIIRNISSVTNYDIMLLSSTVNTVGNDDVDDNEDDDNGENQKLNFRSRASSETSLRLIVYGLKDEKLVDASDIKESMQGKYNAVAETWTASSSGNGNSNEEESSTGLLAAVITLAVILVLLLGGAGVGLAFYIRRRRNKTENYYDTINTSKSDASSISSINGRGMSPSLEEKDNPLTNVQFNNTTEVIEPSPPVSPSLPRISGASMAVGTVPEYSQWTMLDLDNGAADDLKTETSDSESRKDDDEEDDDNGITRRKSIVTFNDNIERIEIERL